MPAWPAVPGVPAAGHVTGGGWWHPGPIDGCPKCPTPAAEFKPGDLVWLDRATPGRVVRVTPRVVYVAARFHGQPATIPVDPERVTRRDR